MRMEIKMPVIFRGCGILAGSSHSQTDGDMDMSRKDAVLLASRALAVLFIVSALIEMSYLPERLHSFLRYANQEASSTAVQDWRHYHLISLGFLVVRIVGFFLIAVWLRRCGPDVEELLLPSAGSDD